MIVLFDFDFCTKFFPSPHYKILILVLISSTSMSKNKELDSIIAEYTNMGFDTENILMAWMTSNQRKTAMLDYLLNPGYFLNPT